MAEGENGDTARSAEDKALKARLENLSSALERRLLEERERQGPAHAPGGETGKAMSRGFRVLAEFVAGILAGGAIGWLLDKAFSTRPIFLLAFGALGTAAGFLNVYRIASQPTGPATAEQQESDAPRRE